MWVVSTPMWIKSADNISFLDSYLRKTLLLFSFPKFSLGESAEGTAPSAARRTVREPLDSHGSHYRAIPYRSLQ